MYRGNPDKNFKLVNELKQGMSLWKAGEFRFAMSRLQ